jgi:Ca2+-binding RTX toxin-like protein
VLRHGNDLQLTFNGSDSLGVRDYFLSTAHRIEQFRFADGQLWSHPQLLSRLIISGATAGNDYLGNYSDIPNRINGLDGHDQLIGGPLNDRLRGDNGNDRLLGRAGGDHLEGGSGDDLLLGEAGKDTLSGGTGNDHLDGGEGADLYRIARGDGKDTIRDYDTSTSNIDQVYFSNLNTSHLANVQKINHDLRLNFSTGDSLTVQEYFQATTFRIEQFRFADGPIWGHANLLARLAPTA